MVTKYGVISDIHNDPRVIDSAIEAFKREGVNTILANGDLADRGRNLRESQDRLAYVVNALAQSGFESYVQPGNHESLLMYAPVLDSFSTRYPNIIDATRNRKVGAGDHHLVFLPGSDSLAPGAEYKMGDDPRIPSGRYLKTKGGLLQPFDDLTDYVEAKSKGMVSGAIQYHNMNDLRKLVTHPEKTIAVCHVPRRFDNLETSVDWAEFGEAFLIFKNGAREVRQGAIFLRDEAERLRGEGKPISLKEENRGNKALRDLYEELGITKAVSGHFHESGHRAHDLNGNPVPEGEFVSDLFWNSGHLDVGQTGILRVDGEGNVSYKNIKFEVSLER